MHGWPQQEAQRLSAVDEIHSIADLIEKLKASELKKRLTRENKSFSRHYFDLDDMEPVLIRKCDFMFKCNAMMVRQATFDFGRHQLLLRSVLCLCDKCLKGDTLFFLPFSYYYSGDFYDCEVYDHTTILAVEKSKMDNLFSNPEVQIELSAVEV